MIKQLFFCVSTPTVLSLGVDSVLSHKSLWIVLDYCIAASREIYYIQLYHSVLIKLSPGVALFTN